jgi:hypothetical protein
MADVCLFEKQNEIKKRKVIVVSAATSSLSSHAGLEESVPKCFGQNVRQFDPRGVCVWWFCCKFWLHLRISFVNCCMFNTWSAFFIFQQVAASIVCAAASGRMFFKWRNLSSEHRLRVWSLYGWFTVLLSVGSIVLAFSIASWTGFLVNFYPSSRAMSQTFDERKAGNLLLARVSTRSYFLLCF